MIELNIILTIIVAHFFADWVAQNDDMAQGKSKSLYWLSTHVLTFGMVFLGIILVVESYCLFKHDIRLFTKESLSMVYWWVLLNVLLHWITDFFTSKATSWLYPRSRHYFFTMIGLDQMIHYCTYFITYENLLK